MFHIHARTHNQFVVLAPGGVVAPRLFKQVEFDGQRRSRLMAAMQRLRGQTYAEDGAIAREELTGDGRHETPDDERAWHVLSVNPDGNVGACLRFLDERRSTGFGGLWVSHAAIAHCPRQGWKLRRAVEFQMQLARVRRIGFGSVGGWAAARQERLTTEPVAIILATYGLLELLGGCIGVATATFRHHSSAILRKIGLSPISWSGSQLNPYFDPQYGCEMEVLEFDSANPAAKYRESIKRFAEQLASAPVLCAEPLETSIPAPAIPAFAHMAAVA